MDLESTSNPNLREALDQGVLVNDLAALFFYLLLGTVMLNQNMLSSAGSRVDIRIVLGLVAILVLEGDLR